MAAQTLGASAHPALVSCRALPAATRQICSVIFPGVHPILFCSDSAINTADGLYGLCLRHPNQRIDSLDRLDMTARRHHPSQGVKIIANFAECCPERQGHYQPSTTQRYQRKPVPSTAKSKARHGKTGAGLGGGRGVGPSPLVSTGGVDRNHHKGSLRNSGSQAELDSSQSGAPRCWRGHEIASPAMTGRNG